MSTNEAEVTQQTSTETPKEQPKPAVEPGVQKRINELTWKHREAERRAVAAETRARELEAKAAESAKTAEPEKRKTLADFNFDDVAYEDYLAERVTKRASETAVKEATKAVDDREQKKAQQTETAERQKTWRAKVDDFTKSHPDFVEVVYAEHAFTDVPDAVAQAILDSEPQVAYHLAQNPDELSRISRLSPVAVGRELGKLEAKLTPVAEAEPKDAEENASAETKVPPAPKPGPTPKLNATGDTGRRPSTTSAESDKLSDDEWFKAEKQRLASKRAK